MLKGVKKTEDLNARIISKELFGEFKYFKDNFMKMKHGSLPANEHKTPYAIAMISKMDDWPMSYRQLKALSPVCYFCKARNLFSECKLCLKAVAGECKGFFEEATDMDIKLQREIKKIKRKKEGNKK